MVLNIEDTVGSQIQVLDDGTSVTDIMMALGWFRKEKARQKARKYVPTGRPMGRPKKTDTPPQK
jgi:hypothetical protein